MTTPHYPYYYGRTLSEKRIVLMNGWQSEFADGPKGGFGIVVNGTAEYRLV